MADIKASVEGRGSRSKKRTEKSDVTVTVENQAAYVWKFLSQQNALYKDPYDAWKAALVSRNGGFCQLDDMFQPRGSHGDVTEWLLAANESGYVTLEMETDPSVFMSMSISKILRNGKEKIEPAGHFGARIRGAGKIRLTVWGRMDRTKYVKPYLVAY